MADKCITVIKKQQGPKIIDEQHQSSVTTDSITSTEVKTAINVNDKNTHNAKSMLSCIEAAESESVNTAAFESRTTAHTPTNDTSTTLIILPNDNSTPMNTIKTVIEEITTSPSSSSSSSVAATATVTAAETTAAITPAATTPVNKGNEIDYLNENDNETDEISDNGHNFLYAIRANMEKVMYLNLETPVLDDNNELLETESSAVDDDNAQSNNSNSNHRQYHHNAQKSQMHYCKRNFRHAENASNFPVTKPKRLSDEFNSADNDDIEINEQMDKVIGETCSHNNCMTDAAKTPELLIGEGSPDDNSKHANDAVNERLENLTENNMLNTIVDLNRPSGITDDDETSTSSLNLLSNITGKQQQLQEHMEDSSSPHSSMSPAEVVIANQKQIASVADVVEELANHGYDGDEHQQHRIVIENNIFYSNNSSCNNVSNDVQSMDAIERRDFINEQEATGSCLLGTSSLIINGTNGDEQRLNLDILGNTFSQKMEQIAALTEERATKRDTDDTNSTSNCAQSSASNKNNDLTTTPTTSRVKRSRLNFASEKGGVSLARSLEKREEPEGESASSCSKPISSWNISHAEAKVKYYPTNSNDSLSSDNQFAICEDTNAAESNQADRNEFAGSKAGGNESSCAVCSSCNKEDRNDDEEIDDESMDTRMSDEDYEEEKDDRTKRGSRTERAAHKDEIEYEENDEVLDEHSGPSTSRANTSNTCCNCAESSRAWNRSESGCCSNLCKNKHSSNDNGEHKAATLSNASVSYRRNSETAAESANDNEEPSIESNFKVMMGLEPENPYADWSVDVNSDGEEVCTCRDYTDNEVNVSSEDELPSRDVDLSCYSISGDMLNSNANSSSETPTTRNHRKRKLTENRSSLFSDVSSNCNDSNSNDRKRLAVEKLNTSTTTQPSTPTSSSSNMTLRTPRSVIPTRDNPPPELSDWLNQFKQWSHVERLVAVDRLIEHCEPTQVRHMMKVIEPQFQRDFISLLPEELALQVLSYLTPKDLLRAAQTCKSWRALCDDNLLWKEKCKQLSICIETSTDRPKRGRVGNMPPISSPWKAAYMRQHIIEMNWRSRPIREPKILKGHDDHVITCLQFCGNRIVSGSDDNTLKVWSAITGKCLRTLVGHTGGVWSSQMSANIIISGSTDRTLKVWNADNGNCIHTLSGHTSTVRCMHLHDKKVVSGSRDATLRVWDIVQGKCLHTLVGHLAAVRCVQYDGKLVVSGAYDYMVKVWNPETEECLHTLQGHTNRVYSLQFDGVHVVSGSLDTSIRVWDATTGTCKHTLMGHQSLTSGMELRQNILVSGNADSTVKVWDTTNGQCLQTLSGPNKHQSAVTCLQFNSRFVITSSDDGTVKLWDVRTGEFIRNLVTLESGGSGGVVWRIRSNDTKLICAVGSRNGTEETKLMVLDFDVEGACLKCA